MLWGHNIFTSFCPQRWLKQSSLELYNSVMLHSWWSYVTVTKFSVTSQKQPGTQGCNDSPTYTSKGDPILHFIGIISFTINSCALSSVTLLCVDCICDWIWQNPASTHRTTLGDTTIWNINCIIAPWWIMLKKWKLQQVASGLFLSYNGVGE